MQQCPKCKRTYIDDKQKFCTFDGGRLTALEDARQSGSDHGSTASSQTVVDPKPPAQPFDPYKTIAAPPNPQTSGFTSHSTGPVDPEFTENQPTMAGLNTFHMPPPPQQSQPPGQQQPQEQSQPLSQHPQSQQLPQQPHPQAQIPSANSQSLQAGAQAASPELHQQPPPGPARKSSKWPLILGLLALVFVMGVAGVAALFFVVIKPRLNQEQEKLVTADKTPAVGVNSKPDTVNTNTEAEADNGSSDSSSDIPGNATKFESSLANLDQNLAQHFVDFSFYYPNTWDLKPATPGSANFVEVDRKLPPNFSQEDLTVSWYKSKGTLDADREGLASAVEAMSNKFAKNIPEYQKVSEGDATVNSMNGYEFRFTGLTRGTEKGDLKIWGRVVFLPPGIDGEENGVTLIMITTSLAPEIKSIDDVGVTGQLPVILKTFRMEH